MTIYRSDILTAVQADRRINTTLDTTKFNEWLNDFEEQAYLIKTGLNPVQTSSSFDYSISTNPQTIILPSDFREMGASGLGFFIIENGSLSQKLNEISAQMAGKALGFYWITDTDIGISGIEGQTVRCIYTPTIARKTSYVGTDTLFLEDRFKEYAVSYVRKRYFIDIDEQSYLAMEMGYCADREAEYKKGTIKTTNNIRIPIITSLNIY